MARANKKQQEADTVNQDTAVTELNIQSPIEKENDNLMSDQIMPEASMDVTEVNWGAMLDGFSSERSPVLFLKGKQRVRLLPFSNPKEIFWDVETYYRGKTRTKYLVKVLNLDETEAENPKVRALLITRSVVKAIINQAVEGWDLFSASKGHGLVLTKTGQGMKSEVSLSVSPKSIAVPPEILVEAAKMDMAQVAADFSKRQKEKDEQSGEESEPEGTEPAKTSKTAEEDW